MSTKFCTYCICPQLFEISWYISVWPELWMVKNDLKYSRNRIQNRIFTKIKAFFEGHPFTLSTKFHPNPSTTSWDIMLHMVFGPISQWWRITQKLIVVGFGSRSSPTSNQILRVTHRSWPQNLIQIRPQLFEISWKSQTDKQTKEKGNWESEYLHPEMTDPGKHIWPNTFLKYHAICRFWAGSLNGEELLLKFLSSDEDPDLHQSRNNLSRTHTHSVHQVSSEFVNIFLIYRAELFRPIFQWWWIT